jgi:gliding motility-associated-like protein
MLFRNLLLICLLSISIGASCQPQDVEFHLNAHLFNGQKILKVKRDFHDIYLWVLGQNNTVYRVNSITLTVDDYTSKFSSFTNLQFVDIMGHSADTVFIATNSTTLIESANGNLRVFGSADGVPGIINSLGEDLGWNIDAGRTRSDMIIGTDHGMRTFNITQQSIGNLPDGAWAGSSSVANSRIYESTYRAETYKDSTATDLSGWASGAQGYLPVAFNTSDLYTSNGAFNVGYIWDDNKTFGYNVNTVLALNSVADYTFGNFASYFWGTENGMFQSEANYSYRIDASSWSQYLNGIKVNKITDIMGLTSFSNYYDNTIIQQNLLAGTDSGFYFSSNVFNPNANYPPKFVMFKDAEMGNMVINDICVNAVPDARPICENGVWLGADDGLYLLKPDYGAFFNNQQQKLVSFINQPDTLSQLKVCSLDTARAFVTNSYTNIQWYKDGTELPGQSKDTLAITAAGDYNAVVYDPCEAIHIESNHLKVSLISRPSFTFDYPPKMQYCDSTSITLHVSYSASYHYRWYTNGTLNGDTTNSYIVTQSGKYKVEVSACTNSWTPTGEVEVDLINLPVPVVTADKTIYCVEDVATLSVNTPPDASYHINWYQDGILLAAKTDSTSIKVTSGGNYTVTLNSTIAACTQISAPINITFTPAPTFTFNYPDQLQYCTGTPLTLTATGSGSYQYRWYKNDTLNAVTATSLQITQSGKYKVEVSACAGSWVASKEVQVKFITMTVPIITTDKKEYCIGDNVILSLTGSYDSDFNIQWYKDNVLIPKGTGQSSITTNMPGSYTVTLAYSTANTDGTICTQTSVAQLIAFNPPPTVSINEMVSTTLCAGQTVSLTANYSKGTAQWSTGETTDQITITQAGTYKVTVTSPSGCQADTSINVTFQPDPVFSLRDTSICTYKKQIITLTAPPGFAAYSWNNGESTAETYSVTQPQTVSLTVTDANGCQATRQVKVADECPIVVIPNAFTPNGDGINDTWVIEGLDSTGTVKVFSRWGAEIYQSVGYATPWNGECSGKKLPSGVYYYIVTAKNGTQKFSGALTIIY